MSSLKGYLLVPTAQNADTGLWFIFHHESEGLLAFDLTREHPDIPLRHFKPLLQNAMDTALEKFVLYGGDNQSDSAMLILHTNPAAAPDAHVISDHFAFHSFRFILMPGHPPSLTRADDTPAHLDLAAHDPFLVIMGFRLWDMDVLEQELKDWQWMLLPASPDLVFHTPRAKRLAKARLSIN
jgi:putative AlgH/UPF0301 family transcriptional regulator